MYSVNHKNNYKTNYKYILESFQVFPLARKYPSHNDSKNEPFYDKLNNQLFQRMQRLVPEGSYLRDNISYSNTRANDNRVA